MLQAIRSKASSLVAKILFGLLIVTFGIWGIGDIFRNRGADTTVATVGGRKIDVSELTLAVRQEEAQWRQMLRGQQLNAEQLKQFGIVDAALQRLINRGLVDLEIGRLRLAVSDEALNQLIRTNRAFLNEHGVFDPERYRQLVAGQHHMSTQQFEAGLRSDMMRVQLNEAIVDGVSPPAGLVDALYRSRAERRTADIVSLPPSAAGAPAAPDDAEIEAFYEQHKASFTVPELRSFTIGLLQLDDVAAQIKIPEEKLHEEYQGRIAEFHTPEQRRFQQILLTDEAKAREAAAQLAAGKDFAQVAKDVAGAAPETLDLGFFKKDELPPQLGEAAFALRQGASSEPIQDPLGWHILRVTEIKLAETQPFDAVKDKLAKEDARELAGDRIGKLANEIEDALAGGATFADVAQRFDLKQSKLENVDEAGHGPDGQAVELPQGAGAALATAFKTEAGQASQLNELGSEEAASSDGYYLVQVDKVTPQSVKPLEQVKAQVAQLWQQQQREAALEKLAKEIVDEVKGGRKLADIAAQRKLAVFSSAPLQRTGGDPKVPPALVAGIFGAAPGTAVFAKANDGYAVAQVKEVLAPDAAQEGKEVAQFSDRLLAPQMRDDMLQEFERALRGRYPVSIDPSAVARAF